MDKREKVLLMLEIRKCTHNIVKAAFDAMDEELKKNLVKIDGKTYISAYNCRMDFRSLRKDTLDAIKTMGKDFEGILPQEELDAYYAKEFDNDTPQD